MDDSVAKCMIKSICHPKNPAPGCLKPMDAANFCTRGMVKILEQQGSPIRKLEQVTPSEALTIQAEKRQKVAAMLQKEFATQ